MRVARATQLKLTASVRNFTISSSLPEDAVRAINSVAGSTGVTATSTASGNLLFDNDGDDITIENDAAGLRLEVQKMNYLGTETVGVAIDLAASGGNDATRVSGSIKTVSNDPLILLKLVQIRIMWRR